MPYKRSTSIIEFSLRWLLLNGHPRSRFGLGCLGIVMFGAIGCVTQVGLAASLTNWQYDPTANQLEVTVKEGTTPKYFVMAQPARIVLDLPDTEVGDVKLKESYEGVIRQVRVSQFQPGLTRIVLELSPEVALAPEQVKLESDAQVSGYKRWILRPVIAGNPSADTANAASARKVSTPAEPTLPTQVTAKPEGKTTSEASPNVQPKAEIPLVAGSPSGAEFALPEVSTPKILAAPLSVAVPPVRSIASSSSSSSTDRSPQSNTITRASSSTSSSANQSDPAKATIKPAETQKPESTPAIVERKPSIASVLPPAAIGSDVSPVTFEPPPARVSVPPLPPKPAIESKTSLTSVSQVAQLSAEQTTPLPPVTPQLPDIGVDTTPAAQGTLPPPLTLPTSPAEIVIEAPKASPQVSVKVEPPKAIVPPVSSVMVKPDDRSAVPQMPLSVPPTNVGSATNLEIPSTFRIRPTEAPKIRVPPLASQGNNVNSIAVQAPPIKLPPLAPTITPKTVSQLPASSVMQTQPAIEQVSNGASTQAPLLTGIPSSGVMQAPLSTHGGGATLSMSQPSPLSSVSVPPLSSVMQSGGIAPMPQPAVIQPPVSSVIQTPTTNPPVIASQVPTVSSNPSTALVFPPIQPLPAASGAPPTVSVPPLPSASLSNSSPAAVSVPPTSTQSTTIAFGQPLPAQAPMALNPFPQNVAPMTAAMGWQPQTVFQSPNPMVLLPTGTVLALSYPGSTDLKLESNMPRQEVLLLQTEVRDTAGKVVLPRGSYVVGQFQTDRSGSKFIASAIRVGDRTIPFAAESEAIVGNRELSTSTMAIYSGAGALAGGALSNFSGLGVLLGGAAGAAANYFTAPKPAVLQPGQLIPVQVMRDL